MAELTIDAADIAAVLRKNVEGFRPDGRPGAGRAACSRSATASRASPGLPNAAVNELLEFEGGALGLALNLEEETIGAVDPRQAPTRWKRASSSPRPAASSRSRSATRCSAAS